jgi:hypothetical protein|tara:strand:+ start:659 stop:907 length:249 start_codon:yes stop_codon:yes gene_type:complete
MGKAKKINKEQLEKIQSMNNKFNELRIKIGDLEIQKQLSLQEINLLKADFAVVEKELEEEYGKNSTIDLSTGEITKKLEKIE